MISISPSPDTFLQLPTAEIALNTMLISDGIYLSGQKGRELTREEIISSSKSNAIEL